jgi:hypothetical protein
VRQEIRKTLLAAGMLALATAAGCRDNDRQAAASAEPPEAVTLQVGPYAIGEGRLYRVNGGAPEVLAVLPGAGGGADTLWECAAAVPGLGRARFRALSLSPDSAVAAWTTVGPGACVGTVGPGDSEVRVLGQWSSASPDSLLWAPAGDFLAVWLVRPGQRRSLAVFDVVAGKRLEMPWEADCAYADDCDVEDVAWLGSSLLNVSIRLGPAEFSVPFEVNVGRAAPAAAEEEM